MVEPSHDGDLIVDELMRIIQVRRNEVAVKEEILGQHHLSRYELSAIIKMSGECRFIWLWFDVSVITENAKLARHTLNLSMVLSRRFVTIRE